MRRYQKWLSLGLMALTPGITLAGPLNSPAAKSSSSPASAQPARKPNPNQELALKVQKALLKIKLSGYDIRIDVINGVVTLDGMVGSPAQRVAAAKAAAAVSGITKVNNRLGVSELPPRPPVQQAAATMPRAAGRAQPVRQANFQVGYEGQEPVQVAPVPEPMSQMPAGPAGIPAYGQPGSGASHTVYNQPNFPNYSWPSYAQYPNYAAVTYPSQFSASAWPYIGPFYPYPQVPLGWRKAQLEWDDGYWNLNFRPRTDRWWWFLDPKNW